MGLYAEQCEIPCHCALGDAGGDGGRAHAPVRGVLGLALHYQLNQLRHLFVIVCARSARPQFVMRPRQPAVLIASAPMANRRCADSTAPRHFPIGLSVPRQQYDARAPHQRMRHAARAHHRLQLQAVSFVDRQGLVRSTHPRHLACYCSRRRSSCNFINGTLH